MMDTTIVNCDAGHKDSKGKDKRVSNNFTTTNLLGDKMKWECNEDLTFDVRKDRSRPSDDEIFKNLSNGETTKLEKSDSLYISNPRFKSTGKSYSGKFTVSVSGIKQLKTVKIESSSIGKGSDNRSSEDFSTDGFIKNLLWTCPEKIVFDVRLSRTLNRDEVIYTNLKNGSITHLRNEDKLYISNPRNAGKKFEVTIEEIDLEQSGIVVLCQKEGKTQDLRASQDFSTDGMSPSLIWSCDEGVSFDIRQNKMGLNDITLVEGIKNGSITKLDTSASLYIANPRGAKKEFQVIIKNNENFVLSGWVTPAIAPQDHFLDHTYVKVDDERSYNCFGADSGGKCICGEKGKNETENAKIRKEAFNIAYDNGEDGDGHAGVRYGIDGVCHQTANRILFPVNILVEDAKGYPLSSLLYGKYGGNWSKITTKSESLKSQNTELIKRKLGKEIYLSHESDINATLEEITQKIDLLREKYHKHIMDVEYALNINQIVNDILIRFSKFLTDESYFNLFGIKKGKTIVFLDIEKFKKEHNL